MAFVVPAFSRSQVDRAGEILATSLAKSREEDPGWASKVLANWRACHAYPMNTFQATLRNKLKKVDDHAIVAQRLKRAPSIIAKLQRFDSMRLSRMQDVGGLRAIVGNVAQVKTLEAAYRSARFSHELTSSKNYVEQPKEDGYRSVHLVYRYKNRVADTYDGLLLELQLRSRLQHAWATAVETMGTFLGQALKSGRGEQQWRKFFAAASAALAVLEKTAPVPGYSSMSQIELFREVATLDERLSVLSKLQGFAVAANHIKTDRGQGAFHLIVLDTAHRGLRITPYSVSRLEQATLDYAKVEQRSKNGEPIEAVLVSAGPIDALRKAYPNYFLDTQAFVAAMRRVMTRARIRDATIRTHGPARSSRPL